MSLTNEELYKIQLEIAIKESLEDSKPKLSSQELAFFTDEKLEPSVRAPTSGKMSSAAKTIEVKPKATDAKLNGSATTVNPQNSNGSIINMISSMFGADTKSRGCFVCGEPCTVGRIVTCDRGLCHESCFVCGGCCVPIQGQFAMHGDSPYHSQCYMELFNPRCCLCSSVLCGQFYRHPFFENERYCMSHQSRKTCFSCHRKEPLPSSNKEQFIDLPDGRSLCFDCSSTMIMDSSEAAAIYRDIVDFMEQHLGMTIPPAMRQVPVLAVDVQSLNENVQKMAYNPHGTDSGATDATPGIVRGVTLSSSGEIRHMATVPTFDLSARTFRLAPTVMRIEETRDVTAVLVLYGMPRELTASIIAHEATHVWLKLNKRFSFRLPPKVEEGICQVVAYRYLEEVIQLQDAHFTTFDAHTGSSKRHDPPSTASMKRSGERKAAELVLPQVERTLCNYFLQQIMSDPNPVYGDGFREAWSSVQALGLDVVFEHIQQTQSLPSL